MAKGSEYVSCTHYTMNRRFLQDIRAGAAFGVRHFRRRVTDKNKETILRVALSQWLTASRLCQCDGAVVRVKSPFAEMRGVAQKGPVRLLSLPRDFLVSHVSAPSSVHPPAVTADIL
jgi:hypothetical protein